MLSFLRKPEEEVKVVISDLGRILLNSRKCLTELSKEADSTDGFYHFGHLTR